jgi:hypothetical protein
MFASKLKVVVALLSTFAVSASALAAPQYHLRIATHGVKAAAGSASPVSESPSQPIAPAVPGVPNVSFVESSLAFGIVYTNGPNPTKRYLHIQNTGTGLAQDNWETGEAYNIGSENGQVVVMDWDDEENTCYQDRSFYLPAGATCVAPVTLWHPSQRQPGNYSTNVLIDARTPGPATHDRFARVSTVPVTVTIANP